MRTTSLPDCKNNLQMCLETDRRGWLTHILPTSRQHPPISQPMLPTRVAVLIVEGGHEIKERNGRPGEATVPWSYLESAIVPAAGGLARRQSLEDRGAGPVDVGGEDDHAVVIELHIRQTVAEVEGHTGRDLVPVADRDTVSVAHFNDGPG